MNKEARKRISEASAVLLRRALNICSSCKSRKAPVGYDICDQCLLKQTAVRLNTISPKFSKSTGRRTANRGGYKHASTALQVDPESVPEQMELLYKSGVGVVEHTPDGKPIFTSDLQFQKANMAIGLKTGRDGYDNSRKATGREPEKRKQAVIAKYAAM